MKVYLAGAINGCTDAEAKDWRGYVMATYPGHTYLDPMTRDFRGRENEPGIDAEIVEGDIDDILDSDVLLVNYDKPSVGTSMEVFFARQVSKHVVIVARPDTKLSPWLTYHAHAVVHSFAEAMKLIDTIQGLRVSQEKALNQVFDLIENSWQTIFPGAHFDARVDLKF